MSRGETAEARRKRLSDLARALPEEPGAYLFLDADGRVIYVGKAKSLRARVRSYFANPDELAVKVARTVEQTHDIDYLVTRTELEALLLEYNLIQEHRPRYNVVYRDDKRYPYLKVTLGEPFPRVMPTRRVENDGSRYFGPYADVGAMRRTLRLLGTLFPLPSCSIRLTEGMSERGCLDYFLGRCQAPCRGEVDRAEYRNMVDDVLRFLEGKRDDIVAGLEREMGRAARELRFEEAAKLRDRLASLRRTVSPQHVSFVGPRNVDAVGFARLGRQAIGVLLAVRDGRLLGRDRLETACTPREAESAIVRGLVLGFFAGRDDIATQLLLPCEVPDADLLEEWLSERAGHVVRLRMPKRGDGRRVLEMAEHNAQVALTREDERGPSKARVRDDLKALGEALGLPAPPRRIEGFDISTIQGTDTYASMVVFEEGVPAKGEYRTFRIREAPRRDDPRSIEEAVGRRARRIGAGGRAPDLLLIDGGPTQLSAAHRALAREGLGDLATVSLAKREEVVFFVGRAEPLRLPRRSGALMLLQRVRDESHRFALRAHRRRRGGRVAASALDEIPGVGPARRRLLLQRFGSVAGIRRAGRDEIAQVPGIGREIATAVWTHLGGAEEK